MVKVLNPPTKIRMLLNPFMLYIAKFYFRGFCEGCRAHRTSLRGSLIAQTWLLLSNCPLLLLCLLTQGSGPD